MSEASLPAPLRDWLATQRTVLNGKFRLAQRRYPTLQAESALGLVGELLPAIVGRQDHPELFATLFDLLLLHAGRGLLAPRQVTLGDTPGGRSPALSVLFRETFPRLLPLLVQRPRQIPGALSNAVENLGDLGLVFARRLAQLAEHLIEPDDLPDAGAVLAWQLGDARLRSAALERLPRLSPELQAELLDLRDWPREFLPVVLHGLHREGWLRPDQLLPAEARTCPAVERWMQQMDDWEEQVGGGWTTVASLGNFLGFEGLFAEPPVLLEPGPQGSRHRFWVRSGGLTYRIEGDAYGCICRADGGVAYPQAPRGAAGDVPLPPNTTSVLERPDLIAWTHPESFRVRVLIRPRKLV